MRQRVSRIQRVHQQAHQILKANQRRKVSQIQSVRVNQKVQVLQIRKVNQQLKVRQNQSVRVIHKKHQRVQVSQQALAYQIVNRLIQVHQQVKVILHL